MYPRVVSILLVMLVAAVTAGGCASVMTRNGIADARLAEHAMVAGLPGVRSWGDDAPVDVIAELRRRLPNMPKIAKAAKIVDGRPVVEILALSGGGANGAFGAGFLAGWTRRGDRPQFEVVTGVSAGALIAPFAYLGAPLRPRAARDLDPI